MFYVLFSGLAAGGQMMFGSGLKWGTEERAQTKVAEEGERDDKGSVPTARKDAQTKQEEKVDPMGMNKKMRSTRTLSMALQKVSAPRKQTPRRPRRRRIIRCPLQEIFVEK